MCADGSILHKGPCTSLCRPPVTWETWARGSHWRQPLEATALYFFNTPFLDRGTCCRPQCPEKATGLPGKVTTLSPAGSPRRPLGRRPRPCFLDPGGLSTRLQQLGGGDVTSAGHWVPSCPPVLSDLALESQPPRRGKATGKGHVQVQPEAQLTARPAAGLAQTTDLEKRMTVLALSH